MIGLLTCFEHHNYGSMLQAYATEIAMEKLGVEYKTIKKRRSRDYMKQPLWLYMMKKLLVLDYRLWLGKQKIKRAKKQNPTFAENAKNGLTYDFKDQNCENLILMIFLPQCFILPILLRKTERHWNKWRWSLMDFWLVAINCGEQILSNMVLQRWSGFRMTN